MTYQEAREYMERIGSRGSVYGLEGIRCLMKELGDVQERLSVIHIAGTNGKGSVGTFLSFALAKAGYTVGRYCSPAVFSPFEVWQINGVCITGEEYAKILSQVKDACDILVSKGMSDPTVFEVETAMAFLYFYRKKCDYVLLEAGMGGETDATNIIKNPVCSVITSISRDHMQFLGETIEEIAVAKAGIIKRGCPVVTIRQKQEVMEVLRKRAAEEDAEFFSADTAQVKILSESAEKICYLYREADGRETEIRLQMTGSFQIENSLLALAVLKNVLKVWPDTAAKGFKEAVWPGRFEIIGKEPLFVIDGAHNTGAAEKLRETIQKDFTNRRITYIIGVLADKEYNKILEILLPYAYRIYTVTPDNPRALSAERLCEEAKACYKRMQHQGRSEAEEAAGEYTGSYKKPQDRDNFGQPAISACETVEQAVSLAVVTAAKEDVILAVGSLSYLGEVRKCADSQRLHQV